ncbi:hypothetical protein M2317_002206 [Microbacterium sp. ZKA21]
MEMTPEALALIAVVDAANDRLAAYRQTLAAAGDEDD